MMKLSLAVILGAMLAIASPVVASPIISNVGDVWTSLAGWSLGATSGTAVAVTAHPLWQSNNPDGSGAVWISYDFTGRDDSTLAPWGNTSPVMRVIESFSAGVGDSFWLKVWADDTAKVFLWNGSVQTTLFDHKTWAQGICEINAISCAPTNFGAINYTFSAAGNYQLWFDAYQTGTVDNTHDNPFGLLYEGQLEPVPEPGTLLLIGTGLVGLVVRARRGR